MVVATENNSENHLLNSDDGKPPIFERRCAVYKDYSSRFRGNSTNFSKQFAHMYACRLEELREILVERAEKKWSDVPIVKLADLEHQEDKRCIIIGTLYKHQQWKPSILRELCDETVEIINEPRDDYCDDKDQPFLEDEMLRIKLVGERIDITEIITGVVCAILGHKTDAGTFDMEDWCFPGCPQKSLDRMPSSEGKIVIVSGLDLSNTAGSLSTNLLAEWLNGMAGNRISQSDQSNIVRLVIAGNSVATTTIANKEKNFLLNDTENTESIAHITDGIVKLDDWLEEILPHCCVTLMPGEHDPTNFMLPQEPMHRFMLQKSFRYESLNGASNPWIGKIANRLITGTSGQPIEDIARVCGKKKNRTPIEWLEKTLIWRHLCPTAPDTLPSHPYFEKDLFIMKDCPDIYFVSNTEKFETKLWNGDDGQIVRLICVPRFSTTNSAVFVDLETLDTETITFGTG